MTALSRAEPTLPIDCLMPIRAQAARKLLAVYSLPWSVCMITPAIASLPPRIAMAIASAAWANSASWCSSIAKPTTRREPTSSTVAILWNLRPVKPCPAGSVGC